jgi:arsenate reductase
LVRELDDSTVERDYAKESLTTAELRSILAAAGGVSALLNTRHATAKANGWKENPPPQAQYIAAVQEEPNLIRRPILVRGKRAVVGREPEAIRALLAGDSA